MVVAVVLLLWGADTLARISAQTLLEQNIQEATGVEVRPEVEVQGLFFLPQVIRGVYSEVHVTTRGITSRPLRIDRVDSQLFDVQVPFHDVLVRNIRQVAIGRSVENLDLTYDDLNAYLEATGRKLKLSPGSDGTVTLSGNVNILGRSLRVSADVTLSVQDDLLRISPQNFGVGAVCSTQPPAATTATTDVDGSARHSAVRASSDRRSGRSRRSAPHSRGHRPPDQSLTNISSSTRSVSQQRGAK